MAYQVTATSTGTTSAIQLPASRSWAVQVTSGTWGAAKIETSADGGTNWVTLRTFDDSADIALTANRTYVIPGGLSVRLNVSSYTAAIVMNCQPVAT